MRALILVLCLSGCLRPDQHEIVTDIRYETSECGGTYLVVTSCDTDLRNCLTRPMVPGGK